MTYTFHPEVCEIVYNAKMRKQFKEFLKKPKNDTKLKFLTTDSKIFQTERINRQALLAEQPVMELKPESMTL